MSLMTDVNVCQKTVQGRLQAYWTIRRQTNSPSVKLRTGQLKVFNLPQIHIYSSYSFIHSFTITLQG